jgi:hypothetical protein
VQRIDTVSDVCPKIISEYDFTTKDLRGSSLDIRRKIFDRLEIKSGPNRKIVKATLGGYDEKAVSPPTLMS